MKAMEYGKEIDSGAHHCNSLTSSKGSIKDCRLVKCQPNGRYGDPVENKEVSTYSKPFCRSNSNINLLHALHDQSVSGSRTGIAPSSAKTNESFFAMLQDYQPAVLGVKGTDQRSPGPAEFMQGKVIHVAPPIVNKETERNSNHADSSNLNAKRIRDPKVKNKLQRFLIQTKNRTDDDVAGLLSLPAQTKGSSVSKSTAPQHCSTSTHGTCISLAALEEQHRQRVFAHYDCQSLAAHLSYSRKIRGLSVSKASSNISGSSTASTKTSKESLSDTGLEYTHCNELLENCPYFSIEIGGENENITCLISSKQSRSLPRAHKPVISHSVSILEPLLNETLWRVGACPFQNDLCLIEAVDHGAHYYRWYFYNQKHENWFGMDERLGPLAISIKREKLHDSSNEQRHQQARFQFRIIIRTSELLTLRGLVIEDSILNPRGSGKSVSSKELLEYVAPEIQLNCLRMGVNSSNCEQQILKLDEQGLTSKYKVGILYCRNGQSSEEDMYNNEDAGPAFTEFLETIGKSIRLKGFQQYKAGLDNKTDSTGTHSVHAIYKDCEVMFHVCTMLPFTPNNRQQLLRKRHIGNDIVTIIFQEPGALPFNPQNIRSQFQHVFIIVRAINPCTDKTTYRVAVSRSKEVPVFGPPLPANAIFSRNKAFAEFILAKTINAENAAHRSEKFANLATRTRREYLKDLCVNYSSSLYIDHGNKFSIFPSKKKEKPKIRFFGDVSQRGAICWQIMLQDHGLVECFLGISLETFVIIEESSKNIIFVTPTRSILGWCTSENSTRVFYHNGECITINMRYSAGNDEQQEVMERLRAVTLGNGVVELSIKRNMIGQLGFHVQPGGIVTQVDNTGQAWAAGLRRGYRLVEVCNILVATLSYGEMIDLLKTSPQLTFIVIKSFSDSTPRRGCFNKYCKLNCLSVENDYEDYRSSKQHFLPHKSTSSGPEYRAESNSIHTSNSSSRQSNSNDKFCGDAEQKQNITLSLYHQYTVKSFDHSKLEKSNSLPLNLIPPTMCLSDCSKANTFLLNDKSKVARQSPLSNVEFSVGKQTSDNRKILKHRCSKYEITELKCLRISPSESFSTDNTKIRNHPKDFEESTEAINSTPTYKCSISNVHKTNSRGPGAPSSSPATLPTSISNFNPMNNIQRNMSNYSRTNAFRRNLFDIINPNCSSQYDSLIATKTPTADSVTSSPQILDNVSALITSDLKQSGMQRTFEGVKERSVQISFTSSRPATILSQRTTRLQESMDQSRHSVGNNLSVMPPLLPDAQELDWTSLVDTATKAIILQLRDDKSCKPLSLRNNIDDIKNYTGSNLQKTTDSFSPQSICASELQSHLNDLESRIVRETRYHKSLEYTILRLSEENQDLQYESQAALQQLQSFTNWFHQTITRAS